MSSELLKDLENKVVIVTGSSSGIGEATALLFAKIGSKVVITGRNEDRVLKVSQKCESLSPFQFKPLTVICDLSIDEDVKQLVNKTIEKFGSIDCLVTAAGINNSDLLANISDSELLQKYDIVMRVDVRSKLLLCQLCSPYLAQTKGSIVNISSVNSIKPIDGFLVHAMSTAAVDMLTKSLALELGAKGVRVNSVK
ncbi:short-chain dehydrogenease/reductase-like protein [Leptotrombidium deliense]|uniref:Short-chain dehydrogenease/reductase-like protein n=1 Tax=Leptotrombidium deliense TaxID=299467 RepID=A0A443S3E0_9ACAR|nr:short-chain dehydrogenease/reductase-like protein [Leptotrombidium deliense]